jgi:hypothetical protein
VFVSYGFRTNGSSRLSLDLFVLIGQLQREKLESVTNSTEKQYSPLFQSNSYLSSFRAIANKNNTGVVWYFTYTDKNFVEELRG